jgi:hypothetical protein
VASQFRGLEQLCFHRRALAGRAADLAADFADLAREVFLDHFPPDAAAFTIFVGASFEAGQLLAPLPDEGIEPDQFRFQLQRLALLAFHHFQRAGG